MLKIMKKMLILFRFLFIIFISIVLSLIIIVSFIYTTIMNEDYIKNAIEKNNYYEQLSSEIYENLSMYVYQSGFDESVLENVCNIEIIKSDIETTLSNFYNDKSEDLKYINYIDETITNNIKNNAKTSKISDKEIEEFIECIQKEYKNTAFPDMLKYKINFSSKLNNIIKFIIISITFSSTFVYITSFEEGSITRKAFFKNVCYELFIVSFIGLSFVYIIKNNIDVNNIKIFGNSFTNTIKYISNKILDAYKYTNIVILCVGFIIGIINNKTKKEVMED